MTVLHIKKCTRALVKYTLTEGIFTLSTLLPASWYNRHYPIGHPLFKTHNVKFHTWCVYPHMLAPSNLLQIVRSCVRCLLIMKCVKGINPKNLACPLPNMLTCSPRMLIYTAFFTYNIQSITNLSYDDDV